jgi:hypothetical protein
MNGHALEKTPQTGANTGGQLYGQVDERAQQQQRQSQANHQPHSRLPGQARFGQAVAHHGLQGCAFKKSAPHALMLTKAGVSA